MSGEAELPTCFGTSRLACYGLWASVPLIFTIIYSTAALFTPQFCGLVSECHTNDCCELPALIVIVTNSNSPRMQLMLNHPTVLMNDWWLHCTIGMWFYNMFYFGCRVSAAPCRDRSVKKKREISEEEKQEIRESFDLFDSDKDHLIDYHELKVASTHWNKATERCSNFTNPLISTGWSYL